jgi:transposase
VISALSIEVCIQPNGDAVRLQGSSGLLNARQKHRFHPRSATSERVCFRAALSAGLLRLPLTAQQGIYDVQFQLYRLRMVSTRTELRSFPGGAVPLILRARHTSQTASCWSTASASCGLNHSLTR